MHQLVIRRPERERPFVFAGAFLHSPQPIEAECQAELSWQRPWLASNGLAKGDFGMSVKSFANECLPEPSPGLRVPLFRRGRQAS